MQNSYSRFQTIYSRHLTAALYTLLEICRSEFGLDTLPFSLGYRSTCEKLHRLVLPCLQGYLRCIKQIQQQQHTNSLYSNSLPR